MVRVLFVCLGNICRPPMTEFLLKRLTAKCGCEDEFIVVSATASVERIDDPVHRGTVEEFAKHGISCTGKHAVQLAWHDYQSYDYLLGMEHSNLRSMTRILGTDDPQKTRRLLDFFARPRDIASPWSTGSFDSTYDNILEGCNAFLDDLETNGLIHPRKKGK